MFGFEEGWKYVEIRARMIRAGGMGRRYDLLVALVGIGTYTKLNSLNSDRIESIRLSRYRMEPLAVKQVEERLGQVKCAICKLSQFGIDSRTVTGDGNWKGICRSCYYTFPVYTDMEFYLRTQPDVPYRLRDLSCPVCEKP